MRIQKSTFAGSQALTTSFASVTLTVPTVVQGLCALGGLWLYVNTIAAAPTTLTVRISRDSGGDELLTPDFAAEIDTGKTTATKGTAIIDFSRLPFQGASPMYLHIKTDIGTCTLSEALLTTTLE